MPCVGESPTINFVWEMFWRLHDMGQPTIKMSTSLVALEVPITCRYIHVKTDYVDAQNLHWKTSNVEITSQAQQLSTAVLCGLLREICFSPRGVQYTLSPYI